MGGKKNDNKRRGIKNVGFIIIMALIGVIVYAAYNQPATTKELPLSEVIKQANDGQYKKINVSGTSLEVTEKGKDKPTITSKKEANVGLKEEGFDISKFEYSYTGQSDGGGLWTNLLISILPVILITVVIFVMFRSAQGQGNQALSFGKSRARLYGNEKEKVTFKNIAGSDEAKQDQETSVACSHGCAGHANSQRSDLSRTLEPRPD